MLEQGGAGGRGKDASYQSNALKYNLNEREADPLAELGEPRRN